MDNGYTLNIDRGREIVLDKQTDDEYITSALKATSEIHAAIDAYNEKKTSQVKNMIKDSRRLGVKEEDLILISSPSYAYGLPLEHKEGENFNTLLGYMFIIDRKVPDYTIILAQLPDMLKYKDMLNDGNYDEVLKRMGAKSVKVKMPKIEGKEYNSIIHDELREEK